MRSYDIAIVGGGIVGLSLAALLAKYHFSVALIESKQPILNWDANHFTARVSAIHLASEKLFHYLNFDIGPYASLNEMRIWDHTNHAQLHFDSRNIHQPHMGSIIDNRAIVKCAWEKLIAEQEVDFFCPHFPINSVRKKNKILLTLDNNETLETDLVVGADGAQSWVRKQMGVPLNKRAYHQKAIIAVIESTQSHHHCAYQKFLTTGPVALLPLSHAQYSALVWSADDIMSDALLKKSDEDFSRALTNAVDFKLGPLAVISERSQFPLIMQHATEYVADHFALVGDAAHTIHPLAGQGVNLGLMDAACLAQTLLDARTQKKSISNFRTLRRYTRWRKADNTHMISAMRGLKEIFSFDTPAMNLVRSFGLNTIDQCAFIKNQLMEIAIGLSTDLPTFLQIDH